MFPELKTTRLTLRQFQQEDLEPLCEYLNNFAVSRMLTVVPHPYTNEDGEWWLNHCAETPVSDEIAWAIESDRGFSGVVGIHMRDRGIPRLGYWLAEPFWGKGYMSEAVDAVITYCFEELGADKVTSGAFEENDGSLNVLGKNGFQTIGSRPDTCRARGDQEMTLIDVELTRHLWEAMRAVTV